VSEEDDFTRLFERIAREMGIEAKCRLMHREGFEDQGEWFPPYDEYEARAGGLVMCMDVGSARAPHPAELVRAWIEAWR
jgi:hypothetical protein